MCLLVVRIKFKWWYYIIDSLENELIKLGIKEDKLFSYV